MECADYRKKLKEFSEGAVKDGLFYKEMEAHITGCAICKKELLLWQELKDKKQEIEELQKNLTSDSLVRIKYRLASSGREPEYPPAVKKLRQANSMLAMITRRMTGTVIILLALVFIYKAVSGGFQPLTIMLISFAFMIFAVLFFRSRLREKRNKDRE